MAGLLDLGLVEASAAVRRRQVSPVELTEAYLARIAAVEPGLGAYVTVTAERARADALRAERELASGRYRGPLHGLPVGLKDLFDTAGIRTTAGSALRRDHVPAADSAVAAGLRAAGAVLLGKHATHEFAWGGTTTNPHYGPTRNPHAPNRIPGGSSGGSAASVVARTALASVGTDTCGSVRIPAALCGCTALKPTYGRIDLTGAVPLAPSLDHAGPLTRTTADAALLFETLLTTTPGPSGGSPVAGAAGDRAGLRVGRLRGWFEEILDPGVRVALDAHVSRLAALGCRIIDVPVPSTGPVVDDVFDIVLAEAGPYHRAAFQRDPDAFGPDLRAHLSQPPPTASQLAQGRRRLDALVTILMAALDESEVLVCATAPGPAPLIGADEVTVDGHVLPIEWMLTRLTSIFNVAGLPVLSVPADPTPAGLPIGVQLVGRPLHEGTILSLGRALDRGRA
jgi:aspartyl-tRNA(Asn)/glutamyl-tRNA(Gln) amidotransferase subunit A